MSRILVVDDEPAIGWSLRELLTDDGHDVAVAATIDEALSSCEQLAPDAVLLDVRLPGKDGIDAIPDIRSVSANAPIVVMTAFGDLGTAVRAVRAGAFDYLVKPFELDHVMQVVARALAERTSPGTARDDQEADASPTLVGASPPMQEVFKQIALVADGDMPVLVTGPSGSGKQLAARAIHAHGRRHAKPLVTTSLSALAHIAIDAELFGGPNTVGLVERADGGTLLIDEIDQAPPEVQARLVSLLEMGTVSRPDGKPPRRVDVRVLATALSLPPSFRRDLSDLLTTVTIRMPSLDERKDDIEGVAHAILARIGSPKQSAVSPEFVTALVRRDWPGNVRQLRIALEHAVVVAHGATLRPEHLPAVDASSEDSSSLDEASRRVAVAIREWASVARAAYGGHPEPDLHHRTIRLVEATLLREVLAHTGGNRTATARLLGLDRATLRTKLRLAGLDD